MTDATSSSGVMNHTFIANSNTNAVTEMIDEGTNVRESQVTGGDAPYSTKQTVYYQMMTTTASQKKHLHDYQANAAVPEQVHNGAMANGAEIDNNQFI